VFAAVHQEVSILDVFVAILVVFVETCADRSEVSKGLSLRMFAPINSLDILYLLNIKCNCIFLLKREPLIRQLPVSL